MKRASSKNTNMDELFLGQTEKNNSMRVSFWGSSNLMKSNYFRMKTKRKRLWMTIIAAIFLTVFIDGCKDENVATIGVCPKVLSTNPANAATNVPLTQIITVTFNEKMNPATITQASLTLQGITPVTEKKMNSVTSAKTSLTLQGTTSITGTVSYSGTTASFIPFGTLMSNTTYICKVSSSVKDLMGNALQGDTVWSFSTGATILPMVTSTNPANNATGVALNKIIVTATFNMPMDPLTLTTTTFNIKQGTTLIEGIVSYTGITASFAPTSNLLPGTTYMATITTGAKNVQGTPLANDYVWIFSTGATLSPTVNSTDPVNNVTCVTLNKIVTATFNMPMDSLTLTTTTFTLKQGVTPVAGIVSYTGTTAYFKSSSNLLPGIIYRATITTGAKNVKGTPLANNYVWTFTTGSITGLAVISTDPANNDTGVILNKIVTITFNEPIDTLTCTPTKFTLIHGTTLVAGTVSYTGTTVSFIPSGNLLSGTYYTVSITLGGCAPLVNNYVWNFKTISSLGPSAIDLKSVARFGIIAGVGISNNSGISVINDMDVGISPGVRSSITGFPPATILNGGIYASDDIAPPGVSAMLTQAKQDLTDAYLFAEGATSPAPAIVSGDQGGKTLAPGIYKSTSTLLIQSGNLTLDAQGDVNAVWIFQIASDLTTIGGAGGNVMLTGGAQAKNVFWQVGSSATIGDGTSFKGNVLALTSITMNSGATAVGRMLARNGSVVLTSTNIIYKP